jgi:hypothetical protein
LTPGVDVKNVFFVVPLSDYVGAAVAACLQEDTLDLELLSSASAEFTHPDRLRVTRIIPLRFYRTFIGSYP